MQALLTHTKAVLGKALNVWPKAARKGNYISKLHQNNAHHNLDPPPTLLTGLDVMTTLVELQPQKMVQECGQELVLMMEPCFASKHHQISQRLSKVLLKLYEAMGEPKQEQPNQQLLVRDQSSSDAGITPGCDELKRCCQYDPRLAYMLKHSSIQPYLLYAQFSVSAFATQILHRIEQHEVLKLKHFVRLSAGCRLFITRCTS